MQQRGDNMAEEFEKILGADNGNPPDSLRQMYPKVNRNFDKVKAWFTSTLSLINGHIQSAAAHLSEHITYSGSAPGATVKQGIDNTYNRISEIVAQSGDDITELVDARAGYPVLGDRLNASDAQLAETAQYRGEISVGANLNDYVNPINYGSYLCLSSAGIINTPINVDAIFEVVPINGLVKQTFISLAADNSKGNIWTRVLNAFGFSNWVKVQNFNEALRGKTWVSYGDSITAHERWQPGVSAYLGLNHVNCGVSGTCIGGNGPDAMWRDARLGPVILANPDIVTILGGVNDYALSIPLGSESDLLAPYVNKDINKFYGAYSYIIEYLLNWKPSLKIVLMTTMWAQDEAVNPTTNLTTRDYAKAVKNIAWFYGLTCVDLRGEMGLSKYNASVYLDVEKVHPSVEGSKLMSELVIDKFKKIMFI